MPQYGPEARGREVFDECLPKLQAHAKVRAISTGLQTRPAVTDSCERYQYTRLKVNQIRLLSISIEEKTNNFVCSFHVRDLASSVGAYKAISYCWGDPTCTHRVFCSNGQSLHVTQSAADILNFVVARNPTEFFWIDQLCINQQDLVEKSEQVQQMGKIYSSTKQVVAWLGRGDRRDESAFAFIEMLFGEIKDMERKGLQPTLIPLMSLPSRAHNLPTEMQASRKWKTLSHLLRNPWFERIWVMQEVIMACTEASRSEAESSILLSFERRTIEFGILARVLKILDEDHLDSNLVYDRQNDDRSDEIGMEPPGSNAVKMYSAYREMKSRGTAIQIDSALSHAWHFKASNDRDKLYAVMGFTTEVADPELFPDYKSNVEDVYIVWATKLLKRDNDYPMLLHMAGIGLQRSYHSLPSWVPDFSSKSSEVQLGPEMTRSTRGRHYCASGVNGKTELNIDLPSLTLRIRAIMIDTIYVVCQQPLSDKSDRWYHNLKPSRFLTPDKKFHRSSLEWIHKIEYFLRASSPAVGQNDPEPMEVLWQTILGDYPTEENQIDGDFQQAFESWYHAQRELAGRDKTRLLASISRKPEVYDQAQNFEDLKAASLHDRPVFGTAHHHLLGHGPKGLLLGDKICVVIGGSTPFLLRANIDHANHDETAEKRWKLVGDCFVHGLMYGEGLCMGEPEDVFIT